MLPINWKVYSLQGGSASLTSLSRKWRWYVSTLGSCGIPTWTTYNYRLAFDPCPPFQKFKQRTNFILSLTSYSQGGDPDLTRTHQIGENHNDKKKSHEFDEAIQRVYYEFLCIQVNIRSQRIYSVRLNTLYRLSNFCQVERMSDGQVWGDGRSKRQAVPSSLHETRWLSSQLKETWWIISWCPRWVWSWAPVLRSQVMRVLSTDPVVSQLCCECTTIVVIASWHHRTWDNINHTQPPLLTK